MNPCLRILLILLPLIISEPSPPISTNPKKEPVSCSFSSKCQVSIYPLYVLVFCPDFICIRSTKDKQDIIMKKPLTQQSSYFMNHDSLLWVMTYNGHQLWQIDLQSSRMTIHTLPLGWLKSLILVNQSDNLIAILFHKYDGQQVIKINTILKQNDPLLSVNTAEHWLHLPNTNTNVLSIQIRHDKWMDKYVLTIHCPLASYIYTSQLNHLHFSLLQTTPYRSSVRQKAQQILIHNNDLIILTSHHVIYLQNTPNRELIQYHLSFSMNLDHLFPTGPSPTSVYSLPTTSPNHYLMICQQHCRTILITQPSPLSPILFQLLDSLLHLPQPISPILDITIGQAIQLLYQDNTYYLLFTYFCPPNHTLKLKQNTQHITCLSIPDQLYSSSIQTTPHTNNLIPCQHSQNSLIYFSQCNTQTTPTHTNLNHQCDMIYNSYQQTNLIDYKLFQYRLSTQHSQLAVCALECKLSNYTIIGNKCISKEIVNQITQMNCHKYTDCYNCTYVEHCHWSAGHCMTGAIDQCESNDWLCTSTGNTSWTNGQSVVMPVQAGQVNLNSGCNYIYSTEESTHIAMTLIQVTIKVRHKIASQDIDKIQFYMCIQQEQPHCILQRYSVDFSSKSVNRTQRLTILAKQVSITIRFSQSLHLPANWLSINLQPVNQSIFNYNIFLLGSFLWLIIFILWMLKGLLHYLNTYRTVSVQPHVRLERYLSDSTVTKVTFGSNEDSFQQYSCTICLEEYITGDALGQLKCKHLYHFSCLQQWNEYQTIQLKCPICNTQVDLEQNALNLNQDGYPL